MKSGFKPNFLPDIYCFSIYANGKPVVDKIDLHKKTGGNFSKALIIESVPVQVTDGELALTYKYETSRIPGATTTARLANAIEIIRQ
jgi:hypothetical protein